MIDKEQEIIDLLSTINGVKKCGAAWPKDLNTLPCITITLAGDKATDHRDDRRYLTELEYYVRVFASTNSVQKTETWRCIVAEAVQRMEDAGWVKTFRWEEPGADVRQYAMRFKKVFTE